MNRTTLFSLSIGNVAAISMALLATAASATEGPVGTPNGADGFLAGALPPPGTYGLVFGNHYQANKFMDGGGNSVLPGFSTSANVVAGKVLHMTGTQLLGGNVGLYGALALASIKVNIAPGLSDKRSGLLDPEGGVIVGWNSGSAFWYVLGTVVVPVGSYDTTRIINVTNGYTTLRPQFGFTYAPASGLDLSTRVTYSINSKNSTTDYQSGSYLHADFNAGFAIADGWKLGLQGYWLKQTSDDKRNGVRVGPDGNRAQVLALGPGLHFQGKTASIEVKHLVESKVKNRSKGSSTWVKAVFAF